MPQQRLRLSSDLHVGQTLYLMLSEHDYAKAMYQSSRILEGLWVQSSLRKACRKGFKLTYTSTVRRLGIAQMLQVELMAIVL